MLQFEVAKEKCIRCGLCAKDCPVDIISMDNRFPSVIREKEAACIGCQHCLAVCPTGALSILGHDPGESTELKGNMPSPDKLETLMKGRRSVRYYRDENLDPQLVERLLQVTANSPTGVNSQEVCFCLIDKKEDMDIFRKEVYGELAALSKRGDLSEKFAFFGKFSDLWFEKQVDVIFRGAPHLLVATAPNDCVTPIPDCLIALTYFDLFAQSLGIGTVWNGYAKWAIDDVVPALRDRLGVPKDHFLGYAISFGLPDVEYQRTVEREFPEVFRFTP